METIIEQRIIVLNSKNASKQNGEYLSNVKFNFRDILKKEADIFYVGISLLSAEIPCSFYNVNVNNYSLNYTINSVIYTLVLSEGNYNATTFIAEFISKFSAGGHGYTITMSFNKITGKLTTTKTGGAYNIIYASSPIYEVLGLLSGSSYTISTSLAHPFMLNLLGVQKLKILSPNLSLESYDSAGHTNGSLLHTISVDKPAYSMIVYQNQTTALNRLKNKVINELEIQIRDENNSLIDFNNVFWNMSIILNIYRKMNQPTDDTIDLGALAIKPNQYENNPLPTKTEIKEALEKIDEDNLRELELLMS